MKTMKMMRRKSKSTSIKVDPQYQVFMNPFSSKSTNPKIPDGKVALSAGQRLQSVREFVQQGPTLEFLLVPGINNGLICKGAVLGDPRPYSDLLIAPYTSHANFKYVGPATGLPADDSDQNNVCRQGENTKISQWRIVSQATRFTLTNACEDSDGWFEAIRVEFDDDSTLYMSSLGNERIVAGEDVFVNGIRNSNVALADEKEDGYLNVTEDVVPVVPGPPPTPAGVTSPVPCLRTTHTIGQLVEHPSYVTGKLKDIHKYLFQLRYDGDSRDMKKIGTAVSLTDPPVDDGMDCIYVRIHGRVPTANDMGQPSRIMAHTVSNQEVIYDDGTSLARFHSQSMNNSAGLNLMRRMNTMLSSKAARMPKYVA
jgi:hypothetical protein